MKQEQPNRDFLEYISDIQCPTAWQPDYRVSVCVWAQPGNFLLSDSLVVQRTIPHTTEEAVMSLSMLPGIGVRDMTQQASPRYI